MTVIGLDGKTYKWKMIGYTEASENKSGLHLECRRILKEIFPFDVILEELLLPGCPNRLYADFYIHNKKLMVESDGPQHAVYTPYFHKSEGDFLRGRKRDKDKERWAELNSIKFIRLPHDKMKEWKSIIINGFNS